MRVLAGVLLGSSVALAALTLLRLRARREQSWHSSLPVFKLKNANGMEVHVSVFGAAILKIMVPDKKGSRADVVLGYNTVEEYETATPCTYFGVIVGRVANRIANARFTLNGVEYPLLANDGTNTLHGGLKGLHKRVWEGRLVRGEDFEAVQLHYTSPEGEEGFSGTLHVSVTYRLDLYDNRLTTSIVATTDEATPVNIAQHSYFNLGGHTTGGSSSGSGSGGGMSILGHRLRLHGADHFTPVSPALVPSGEVAPVAGTPFDFTAAAAAAPEAAGAEGGGVALLPAHTIGSRIEQVPGAAPGGYDHNYVLFGMGPQARVLTKNGMASEKPKLAATLVDPVSGRAMDLLTTAPGVQFYSGNFLDGSVTGKYGVKYGKHAGLCLETQGFPNAVNEPNFPTVVLQPQDTYHHDIVYRFYNV
ncbi:hypothetical protein PLESTB_001746800 [Pleodorina starrii]|uniref:Aldose 1-epimerase n=1 Tax=Pleodorina starrii TaxID=330485 RepID=A0A9W6C0Q6_9CHLO|nr:hypothetical protein PLESTM_001672500 [Pleodorina starrii]GLC61355.1 hypothetical protein PLESTB_001746800 [Pleodorina starrii]GLC69333.1 hypothetical protein PLESTF_000818000 [Pleodorina starrii]